MKYGHILMFLMLISVLPAVTQDKKESPDKKGGHTFGLKEVTVFHDALHPLVHDALPKGDFARIRKSLDGLLKKATAIQKAGLPKGLAARKQAFTNASSELVRQLTEMNTMKEKVDDETFEKAFNEMHDTFEQLAELVK